MAAPVPPTTQDKLNEAAYFLGLMSKTEGEEFYRYNVGAFLTAIRSVKDLLLNEVAPGKSGANTYIENAMRADPEMQLLIDLRNENVHDSGLTIIDAEMEEVTHSAFAADPGVRGWLLRRRRRERELVERSPLRSRSRIVTPGPATTKVYEPRWFIKGIKDRDAFTVCVLHYEKIRKAVEDCIARFP